MRLVLLLVFSITGFALLPSAPAYASPPGTVIDTYDTPQAVSVTGAPAGAMSASGSAALTTGTIAGGERDVTVSRTSANQGSVSFDADGSVAGQGAHSQGSATRGSTVLTYDGVDNSSALNATGLGGVDLTDGGQANYIAVGVGGADNAAIVGVQVRITVYTNATSCSTFSSTVPTDAMGDNDTVPVLALMTAFATGPGCTSPANFANVGAIQLLIDGTSSSPNAASADLNVDIFESTGLDFGDLPDTYGTLIASNGAAHVPSAGGLKLGAAIDAEANGVPGAAATGDDAAGLDDEDGVSITPGFAWSVANGGRVDVTVSGGDGCLQGYIDFNNNGVFDAADVAIDNLPVISGTTTVPFLVPGGTTFPNDFYARFRLYPRDNDDPSACTATRSPVGSVYGGEVEDYRLSPRPDLSITKDDGLTVVNPNQTISYTLTIANTGSQDATGVVVTDTIPTNTTYVSSSNSGSFAAGVVTFPSFPLAAGATTTRTVTVSVNHPAVGSTVVNNAAVADDGAHGTDPTPGNNTASDTDTLQSVELSIAKDDGLTVVNPNGTTTYTLTITNNGSSVATGVLVQDTLPTNTTFQSASNSGSHAAGVVTWPTFTLAAGGSTTRTVTVTVNNPPGGPTIVNTATVTDDGTHGPDQNTADNTTTDTDTVQVIELSIAKDDGLTVVNPNGTVTYTLTIANNGSSVATGVAVTDTIPTNTTYVSSSNSGSFAAGVVTFPFFTLAGGASTTRTVTVTVNNPAVGSTVVNNAAVTDDGTHGPDQNTANNNASDTDTLQSVELSIVKTDGVATTTAGATLTYTLTITNNGSSVATGVAVSDTIPTNTTYVSSSNSGSFAAGVVSWPTFTLAAGASTTRTVTVTVDASPGMTVVNNAAVADDGTHGPDQTTGNNTATDTDTVQSVDLVVTKTDGVTTANPGQTLTYTVSLTNSGTATATGVSLTDTIPTGTTYVSNTGGGSFAAGTVTWSIGTLAAGASVSRTVTVTVNSPYSGPSNITNSATATDDENNGPDATPGNNTGTDTDAVQTVELSVTKTDGVTSTTPGSSLTYTLTVTNNGSGPATGVLVTDTIPTGTTYVSSSNSGAFAAGVVTFPTFSLAAGASVTRTVTVMVNNPYTNGPTITNTANVTDDGTHGPDNNLANNTGTDVDTVRTVELAISKTDGVTTTTPGATLTYTLTITNNGNTTATGVVTTDTIPTNTTYVSSSNSGAFAAGVVTWPSFSLAAGASTTRTVTVTVNNPVGSTTVVNNAAVTDDGTNGPDQNGANNTASDADNVNTVELAITKTDGVTTTSPGATLTYTLTITNNGNASAPATLVTDTIPTNTTYVSSSNSGSFAAGVVTWPTFTLAAGGTTTRTVTVTVNNPPGSSTVVNNAAVSYNNSNGPDQNPANNTASDTDTVQTVDLAVTKTDGVTTAVPGQSLTYTISVTNNGTGPATGVVIRDTIPANTTYVSSSNSGTFAAGVVTYPTITIAAGATVTRTVTVTVNSNVGSATSITNSANAVDDGTHGPDQNGGNNTGTDTDTLSTVELAITKTDGVAVANPGDTLTYTLTITNNGTGPATGVLVTDTLPTGTTYVSSSNSGSHAAGVVTWPTFSLAAGASTARTVTVTVNDPLPSGTTTLTNTATVTDDGAHGPDQNPGNNTATDVDAATECGCTPTNTKSIAAGNQFTCALLVGGAVNCWGYNGQGQLGNNSTAPRSLVPVKVNTINDAKSIAAGRESVCVVRLDNTVWCWGANTAGALGNGTTTNSRVPVQVTGITNAKFVSIGERHACAVLADGTVKCWGENNSGQLGDNTTTRRLTPVTVPGITNAVAITAGGNHTCALLADTTVKCWGLNSSGQIGDNTTTTRKTPVAVPGLTGVVAIDGGFRNTCAVLASGAVRCWGANASGQIGDNTTTTRKVPTAVTGISTAVGIDVGNDFACARLASGAVQCWGLNSNGQLGDGTKVNRKTPVTMTGITSAISISAGYNHTAVMLTDCTARTMGNNTQGQLGDGTKNASFTPISPLPFVP